MLEQSLPVERLKRANRRLSALRWLVQDLSVPAMPEYVCFNMSAACNLRCPHCPAHGTPEAKRVNSDPSSVMRPEHFARLANETLPLAREFCLTLSGEPTVIPNFTGILQAHAWSRAKLHATTNATRLSAARIRSLIPIAGTIQLSADGATRSVFEALRLGASYAAFLHNARLLGRTLELVRDLHAPYFGLSCVAMGSNLPELPELVRLAHFIRAPNIQVAGIEPSFPGQESERLELHQARFNYYRARAIELGARLNVSVSIFHEAFSGVVPDSTLLWRSGMILQAPPDEEYYASLPPLESQIDLEQTEAEARDLADAIRAAEPPPLDRREEATWDQLARRLEDDFAMLAQRHSERLRALATARDRPVSHCIYLQQRSYTTPDGAVLACCKPDLGSMGNALEESWKAVWNGRTRHKVVEDFLSGQPPEACVRCEQNRTVPVDRLLREAFPEGL